jgi:rare lipoprotein A
MKSIVKILVLQFLFVSTLFSQAEEFGIVSYYSDLFHGKPTASGEMYDMNKLTAAHKTLPFGTLVRVTRMDNKKSVDVTVNDRGPFISGRVIEVSRAAARILDLEKDGSARVKVEVVKSTAKDAVTSKPAEEPKSAEKPKSYEETSPAIKSDGGNAATASKDKEPAKPDVTNTNVSKDVKKSPASDSKTETSTKGGDTKSKVSDSKSNKPDTAPKAVLVKEKDYQQFDLYQIELKRPEKKGFGVQVAALTSQDALFRKLAELQGDWFTGILVSVELSPKNEVMYKIILGTYPDEASAQVYKDNLKKKKKIDGFVVNLENLVQSK